MKLAAVILFTTLISNAYALELKIMNYNVENLFDTQHDIGKADYEYLPKSHPLKAECAKVNEKYRDKCFNTDWSEAKLNVKLDHIKQVVLASGKPEILTLNEVENQNVVDMLAKKLGYSTAYTSNSDDGRGIDVAILLTETEELKFIKAKEHDVTSKIIKNKPTRKILEAQLKVKGKKLSVFVNHWPSQSNPVKARIYAAKTLRRLMLRRSVRGYAIAVGDFNVTTKDYPHPFNDYLLNKKILDIDTLFRADKNNRDRANNMPLGTYFFKPEMSWNKLDRIFVLTKMTEEDSSIQYKKGSYKINAHDFSTWTFKYNREDYNQGTVIKGIPNRFEGHKDDLEKLGYSDHFPVSAVLTVK